MTRIDRSAFLGGLAGTLLGLWVIGAARVAVERAGARHGQKYTTTGGFTRRLAPYLDRPIQGETLA